MIERRTMNTRCFVCINRLHQIHLDLEGAGTYECDIFIDVFAFAPIVAAQFQTGQLPFEQRFRMGQYQFSAPDEEVAAEVREIRAYEAPDYDRPIAAPEYYTTRKAVGDREVAAANQDFPLAQHGLGFMYMEMVNSMKDANRIKLKKGA